MTASYASWKPVMMSPELVARRIRRGLNRRRAIIAFPMPLYWAARLQGLLPDRLRAAAMLRFRAVAREASVEPTALLGASDSPLTG